MPSRQHQSGLEHADDDTGRWFGSARTSHRWRSAQAYQQTLELVVLAIIDQTLCHNKWHLATGRSAPEELLLKAASTLADPGIQTVRLHMSQIILVFSDVESVKSTRVISGWTHLIASLKYILWPPHG